MLWPVLLPILILLVMLYRDGYLPKFPANRWKRPTISDHEPEVTIKTPRMLSDAYLLRQRCSASDDLSHGFARPATPLVTYRRGSIE